MAESFEKWPGCYFLPSDQELVGYFLAKKIRGEAGDFHPDQVFHEVKNVNFHPSALRESYESVKGRLWHFFVPRKQVTGRVGNSRAGTGHWKGSKCEDVMCEGEKIGKKFSFVFYEGDVGSGTETHWVMDAFIIEELPSWICCRIRDSALDMDHVLFPCGVCGRT